MNHSASKAIVVLRRTSQPSTRALSSSNMVIAAPVITDESNPKEAELTARLLRIQPVSWRWNAKGILLDLFSKNIFKPWNRTEVGVIAQNARDELIDLYPHIAIKNQVGAWTVDYGMLSNAAYDNLVYLDKYYQKLIKTTPDKNPGRLELPLLMEKYRTDNMQLMVVRLLAMVRIYAARIETLQPSPTATIQPS